MAELCWKCGAASAPEIDSLAAREPSFVELPHLLETNDAPLDSDIPKIRLAILEEEMRLDRLDAQIWDTQCMLEMLTRKQKDAARSIRLHRAILSPVRRMPPELLCEIFMLSMGGDLRPPWRLGLVSRFWRQSAILSHNLWSCIHLQPSWNGSLLSIKTQLTRSDIAPLTVIFDDFPIQTSALVVDLLLQHCGRWRTLRLVKSSVNGADKLLYIMGGRMRQLERLELECEDYDLRIRDDSLTAAPRLREVILTDAALKRFSPAVKIPWDQITLYRGKYVPARQCEILQAASNLQECSLAFSIHQPPHDAFPANAAPTSIIDLLRLRRLHLEEEYFLSLLTAPGLEDLFLYSPRRLDRFPAFIQRSSCQLVKLVLVKYYRGTSSDLLNALRALPTLRCLVMEGAFDFDPEEHAALFNGLAIVGTSDHHCPTLSSFSLGHFPSDLALHSPFVAMVKSRFGKHPSCHLRFLRIYNWSYDESPNHMAAQLQIWRREGLDVAWGKDDDYAQLSRGS
ncbi:hypothetical protein C8R43DRAFT_1033112 [Mycena crocata]|nr:hypothetical protein C8R43DRAFT_1033112 [Mycena crocata]